MNCMSAMMDPLLERQRKRVTRTRSGSSNLQTDVRDRSTAARQRSERASGGHDAAAEPDAKSRQPGRRPRRILVGRIILGLVVLAVPVLYSYTIALTGPGSDSLQARS